MDTGTFERSLLALQRRRPFHPFTVALVNGARFQVDYPEALAIRAGTAVFIGAGGVPTLFDHKSVSEFVGELNNVATPAEPSPEQRSALWRGWVQSHTLVDHIVDDSRDSIYAGRGE
jgi:hypothetical protein